MKREGIPPFPGREVPSPEGAPSRGLENVQSWLSTCCGPAQEGPELSLELIPDATNSSPPSLPLSVPVNHRIPVYSYSHDWGYMGQDGMQDMAWAFPRPLNPSRGRVSTITDIPDKR